MRCVAAVVIALAGCATQVKQTYSEEEMMPAAAVLTKVSAAAEANLRYNAASDTLSDAEFLRQSVAHDPGLLAPLSAYQVKAMRQGGHAAILVCSHDGTTALLEDAGCTAAMDRHRWKDDPRSPCAFTVDWVNLCPAAGN
ncbi:MAG: hypothetical protein PHY45_04475 [Rhodocyclaceae bacterium]|nr:hypothetical protein [Rhodocyclaceae bacterium]